MYNYYFFNYRVIIFATTNKLIWLPYRCWQLWEVAELQERLPPEIPTPGLDWITQLPLRLPIRGGLQRCQHFDRKLQKTYRWRDASGPRRGWTSTSPLQSSAFARCSPSTAPRWLHSIAATTITWSSSLEAKGPEPPTSSVQSSPQSFITK